MTMQQAGEHTNVGATDTDRRSVLKTMGLGGLAAAGVAAFGGVQTVEGKSLVTVEITNVLNNLSIDVDVKNTKVALQVCAVVNDINAILVNDQGASVAVLACEIQQG